MRCAGLDIGSRSVELVVIDVATGVVLRRDEVPTGPAVAEDCRRLIANAGLRLPANGEAAGPPSAGSRVNGFDRLLSTGYGRALAEVSFGYPTITEIKAYARGAEALHPGCRTVLDVGGQDTKVISVDGSGRALRFEMNDRCAAGAGRFLEMIATALHYGIEEFGEGAMAGRPGTKINSMCAVFSESEVIGLMTRGTPRADIALAVHEALAQRIASQILRVGAAAPIVFAGGAARNPCLRRAIEERIAVELHAPEEPQMTGALGAALLAASGCVMDRKVLSGE